MGPLFTEAYPILSLPEISNMVSQLNKTLCKVPAE